MTEKPFVHKEAFVDAKTNFLYQNEVAKIIPKILDEKGILNIGSNKVETMFDFAKKTQMLNHLVLKKLNTFQKIAQSTLVS